MNLKSRPSVKLILLLLVLVFILSMLLSFWEQYLRFYKNFFSSLPFSFFQANNQTLLYESMMFAEKSQIKSQGELLAVYAFKGMLPGAKVNISKGDQVIIHLYNQLDEAADIHWHGIEQGEDSDGLLLTELLIAPNSYYRYEFIAPKSGTFWYHPNFSPSDEIFSDSSGAFIIKKDKNNSSQRYHNPAFSTIDVSLIRTSRGHQDPFNLLKGRNNPMYHCPGLQPFLLEYNTNTTKHYMDDSSHQKIHSGSSLM